MKKKKKSICSILVDKNEKLIIPLKKEKKSKEIPGRNRATFSSNSFAYERLKKVVWDSSLFFQSANDGVYDALMTCRFTYSNPSTQKYPPPLHTRCVPIEIHSPIDFLTSPTLNDTHLQTSQSDFFFFFSIKSQIHLKLARFKEIHKY